MKFWRKIWKCLYDACNLNMLCRHISPLCIQVHLDIFGCFPDGFSDAPWIVFELNCIPYRRDLAWHEILFLWSSQPFQSIHWMHCQNAPRHGWQWNSVKHGKQTPLQSLRYWHFLSLQEQQESFRCHRWQRLPVWGFRTAPSSFFASFLHWNADIGVISIDFPR